MQTPLEYIRGIDVATPHEHIDDRLSPVSDDDFMAQLDKCSTPRPSESVRLKGSIPKDIAKRMDSFTIRFQSYDAARQEGGAEAVMQRSHTPPVLTQFCEVSLEDDELEIPAQASSFVPVGNEDPQSSGTSFGSAKRDSAFGSTTVPPPVPQPTGWVPTNEYEVYKAECSILAPIRSMVSQFTCADINTVSSIHPRVTTSELQNFREKKQVDFQRDRNTLQSATPASPGTPALQVEALHFYSCQIGSTSDGFVNLSPLQGSRVEVPSNVGRNRLVSSPLSDPIEITPGPDSFLLSPTLEDRDRDRSVSPHTSSPGQAPLSDESFFGNKSVVWPSQFSASLPTSPASSSLSLSPPSRSRAISISDVFIRTRKESVSKSQRPSVASVPTMVPTTQTDVLDPIDEKEGRIIVCVHGCYGGLGQWLPLWKEFAACADVYAMDLPGFGRSIRPDVTFDGPKHKSAQVAIDWFHGYFDQWFKEMNFPRKVTLIAHSFGAYLFSLYAKKRPEYFEHLFLADPWGVRPYDPERDQEPLPRTVKALFWSFYNLESGVFTLIKAAGPVGPKLIPWLRPELGGSWAKSHSNSQSIYDYLYQCNVHHRSIGESGFRTCCVGPACPQLPLQHLLADDAFPTGAFKVSFAYGMQSRFNNSEALETFRAMKAKGVDVTYDIVPDAGHQIMSDNPAALARMVLHHTGLKVDPTRDEDAIAKFVEDTVAECTKMQIKLWT
eukprot:GILI01001194.1.p1 GENE.GILI01001194.1~~GILI01001194.1.p1  ORF type:complete len:734 (-),score=110.62 GILI01001194.1:795-2963(-)